MFDISVVSIDSSDKVRYSAEGGGGAKFTLGREKGENRAKKNKRRWSVS